jgi:FixJ family two-component response regulator
MSTEKLLNHIKPLFTIKDLEKESKKKSLQDLLIKLKERKKSILKALEKPKNNKALQEDLNIISLHIKKGERLLHDLLSNK